MAERPIPKRPTGGGVPRSASCTEDAELIEKVRADQPEAFGALVLKYQDRVFNTCWRISGHLEDARDLTQEAFLKAFEKLDSFRQESSFYTWLFRIAVNLARTHRRAAARRQMASLDDDSAAMGGQAFGLAQRVASDSEPEPQARASAKELQGRVARALLSLDGDQRAVVVLRDIEGFDYEEISQILEVPTGTVKSRLHRARAALAKVIRPEATNG